MLIMQYIYKQNKINYAQIFIVCLICVEFSSLVAQMVKNLPAMQETIVWSLCWEDPLEKEMASHSSILAWRIPWTEKPGGLQSTGLQRVGHDWATSFHFTLTKPDQLFFPVYSKPGSSHTFLFKISFRLFFIHLNPSKTSSETMFSKNPL